MKICWFWKKKFLISQFQIIYIGLCQISEFYSGLHTTIARVVFIGVYPAFEALLQLVITTAQVGLALVRLPCPSLTAYLIVEPLVLFVN